MIFDIFVDYIAVFRLNPVSCWFLDIFHYCMYPSYSQGFPVELPSQGAELFPSAVKISLPGHHPVELVVPRREFFGPWDGHQGQVAHWCGYMWISCPHYIHHILHNYYIIDHNITLNNFESDINNMYIYLFGTHCIIYHYNAPYTQCWL